MKLFVVSFCVTMFAVGTFRTDVPLWVWLVEVLRFVSYFLLIDHVLDMRRRMREVEEVNVLLARVLARMFALARRAADERKTSPRMSDEGRR